MDKVRVSIITATFNRSEVLRFAIDSVRNQTFSAYGHIIVGDAPEPAGKYGQEATNGMRAIAGNWLSCDLTGEKTFDREVGYCTNAAGQDIGEAIIVKGLALACAFYSERYVALEQPEALTRLSRAPPSNGPSHVSRDPLIDLLEWCKSEHQNLQKKLEILKSGKFRIGKIAGRVGLHNRCHHRTDHRFYS